MAYIFRVHELKGGHNLQTVKSRQLNRKRTATFEELVQAAIWAVLKNEVEIFLILATTVIVNDVIMVGQLA